MENEQTIQKKINTLGRRSSNYMSLKHMKSLIVLVVGLLAVGCLTPEQKQKALRVSVVGEYEFKADNGDTSKLVLGENSVFVLYTNGQRQGVNSWPIVDGEIHFLTDNGYIQVAIINQDKSITQIAMKRDGKRTDIPKEDQITWKKIK